MIPGLDHQNTASNSHVQTNNQALATAGGTQGFSVVLMAAYAGIKTQTLVVTILDNQAGMAERAVICGHGAIEAITGSDMPIVAIKTSVWLYMPGKITTPHYVQIGR